MQYSPNQGLFTQFMASFMNASTEVLQPNETEAVARASFRDSQRVELTNGIIEVLRGAYPDTKINETNIAISVASQFSLAIRDQDIRYGATLEKNELGANILNSDGLRWHLEPAAEQRIFESISSLIAGRVVGETFDLLEQRIFQETFSQVDPQFTDAIRNPQGSGLLTKTGGNITGVIAPHCFVAGTSIQVPGGQQRRIEDLRVGDLVEAFDNNGPLVDKRIVRLFENVTLEWVRLSNGLTVTPGHHFLDANGGFRAIAEILDSDGQIVSADGEVFSVTGDHIYFSEETAHLYEEAEGYCAEAVGVLALPPIYKRGWRTYNFEVEQYHTYVANGIRVHNASVFTPTGLDLNVGQTYKGRDGYEYLVNGNGSLTNTTSGATSRASSYDGQKFGSVRAAEVELGRSISPSEQYTMANDGAFGRAQIDGNGPSVQLSSGSTAKVGTVFTAGDGYVNVVNSDGSVTNLDTGHTSGGNSRQYNPDTNQWEGEYRSGSDGDDNNGGGKPPLIMDLDGDGIEITPLSSSSTFMDIVGDGLKHRTAWAGAGDGVLVRDHGNDGVINLANEIDFTKWDSTARSDIEALRNVFDTNHDGKLSAADTDWLLFKVLVTNADGTQTLRTFAELGIKELSLVTNNQEVVLSDGSKINGTTTFTRTDNSTGTLADVALKSDKNGYLVTETVTTNGDGSTTLVTSAHRTAGALVSKTTLTTSADGLTRTLNFDDNGDGVTDRIQTHVRVNHPNGSVTDTVLDFDGSGGILVRREVTTTSADRKAITVSTDSVGSGTSFDRVETRVIAADGSQTVTVQQRHADGSERNEVTTTTAVDGLSKSVQLDADGDGVTDATRSEATTVSVGGLRTESVVSYAGNGTTSAHRIGSVVTVASADGSTKAVTTDLDGDGDTDVIVSSAIVRNPDGSTTTTSGTSNGDASLRGGGITILSGDGHTRTIQNDVDGDGDIDRVSLDAKSFGADGSTTQTVENRAGNGATLNKIISTWSADGKTRSTQIDSDGDGNADVVQTVAVVSGSSVETSSTYSPNGAALVARTTATISADGLSRSSQVDVNGDGVYDAVSALVTVKNANGSSTVTEQLLNGAGTDSIVRKVVTTSADGLSVTAEQFRNAEVAPFQKSTSVSILNTDGSVTETVTTFSGSTLAQVGVTITSVSADRLITTLESFVGTSPLPETITTIVVATSGVITETTCQYGPDGTSLIGKTVKTTSSDGLSITLVTDADGDADTDGTTTSVVTLNADGTTTTDVTRFTGAGTGVSNIAEGSTVTKSGNGLAKTTQVDRNGDGVIDGQTAEVLAYNSDGSQTKTVTNFNGSGSVQLGKTIETVSDDGLTKTVSTFLGNHTVADSTISAVTVLAGDASQITTTISTAANGALIGRSVTTVGANGLSQTTGTDLDGDAVNDTVSTSTVAGDGTKSTVVSTYNEAASLRSTSTVTTSATGQSTTIDTDLDGNGTIDRRTTETITLNADGSSTKGVTTYKNAGAIEGAVSTVTSADTLTVATTWEATGTGVTRTQLATTEINVDGSTTTAIENRKTGGVLNDKTVTTVSADGTLARTIRDVNGDGTTDETIVERRLADGGVLTSKMDGSVTTASGREYGTARGTYVTESGNGLVRTTRYDSSGDGLAESEVTEATVLNADGARVQTITHAALSGGDAGSANPSFTSVLKAKAVVTTSADGRSITTDWDATGSGIFASQRSESTILNADGSSTRNTRYLEAGVLKSHHEVVTTGDGLSETTSWNSDGVGTFDQVSAKVFVKNADGSSTSTVTNTTFGGALLSQIETRTSADGRTVVLKEDPSGSGLFSKTRTTVTESLADGTKVVTVTDSDGGGLVVLQRSVTETSADGRIVLISRDADGSGGTDQTKEIVQHVDGSTTAVTKDFNASGILNVHTVTKTSFDGRIITTDQDVDGDGIMDRRTIQTLRQWADGSTETRVEDYQTSTRGAGGPSVAIPPDLDQITVVTTSADGRHKRTTVDVFGDGSVDEETVTVLQINGTSTTTVTASAVARSAVVGHEITWVSAVLANATVPFAKSVTVTPDGRTVVSADYDGDGFHEHEEIWTHQIDGAQRGFFSDKLVGGTVVASGVLTISSDGLFATLDRDNNHDGIVDYREQVITRIDGSVVKKTYERNASGDFDLIWTTISHANAQSLRLHGTAGADVLIGGAGNDALFGEAGNDTLDGAGGADRLEGGIGDDIYIVDDRADQVLEGLAAGTDLVRSSVSYVLVDNVENLTLIGSNAINGTGNELDNVLVGNAAANTLDGGSGNDAMSGGAGDDTYLVDAAGDVITELADEGTELVRASVTYTLSANVENLTLTGSAAIDGTGNDLDNVLIGNSGANTLTGGDGDDVLNGGVGADVLAGGDGFDTASYEDALTGVKVNTGSPNDNTGEAVGDSYNSIEGLRGSAFDDDLTLVADYGRISGGAGNDVLWLRGLDGELHGEDGNDEVFGREGNDRLYGGAGSDALFGGDGNDLLDGGVGDDWLEGGAGDDTIYGGDGDDTFDGRGGADSLDGGAGFDVATYLNASAGVRVHTAAPGANTGEAAGDTYSSIEGLYGSAFADDLTLVVDNGEVFGGDGNDILRIIGDSALLAGGGGDDELHGHSGDDQLYGGNGNDELYGNGGADLLDGESGADLMRGGAGNDLYYVDNASDQVIENSDEGIDEVRSTVDFTLGANLEKLRLEGSNAINGTGNDLDNNIVGNSAANIIIGGGGHDLIAGGGGADTLIGGEGSDTYFVDNAGVTIVENVGEGGDHVISSVDFVLADNVENLSLTGSALIGTGNDLANEMYGNANNNVLSGGAGNDTLEGADGDDVLIGGAGADVLGGGDGFDTASYEDALTGVKVNTGSPNDNTGDAIGDSYYSIEALRGSAFDDDLTWVGDYGVIFGGAGNDVLWLQGLDGELHGEEGNDEVFGRAGNDRLYGGAGFDIMFGGDGNDLLDGGADDDWLEGGAGNDTIHGGDGIDTLMGGAGADSLDGGAGFDYATYLNASAGVRVHTASTGANTGEAAGDTYTSIEALVGSAFADDLTLVVDNGEVFGGGGNDTLRIIGDRALLRGEDGDDKLYGHSGNDHLYGGNGNDELYGGDGDDSLNGEGGADVMVGGTGHDIYHVDHAGDQMVENSDEGIDEVLSVVDYVLGANLENLKLWGSDAINGTGNDLDNYLVGNSAANIIIGGGGHDLIAGGEGADTLIGGEGSDTYFVDNAGDIIVEHVDEGSDHVISSVDFVLGDNVDNLSLTDNALIGTGNALANEMYGNAKNNVLSGGAGNDTLRGADGDDILDGGADNDLMFGGAGADTFVFRPGFGNDGIGDFTTGTDGIEFQGHGTLDFTSLIADATENFTEYGVETWLNFDGGQKIVLYGVALDDLSASDFRFV